MVTFLFVQYIYLYYSNYHKEHDIHIDNNDILMQCINFDTDIIIDYVISSNIFSKLCGVVAHWKMDTERCYADIFKMWLGVISGNYHDCQQCMLTSKCNESHKCCMQQIMKKFERIYGSSIKIWNPQNESHGKKSNKKKQAINNKNRKKSKAKKANAKQQLDPPVIPNGYMSDEDVDMVDAVWSVNDINFHTQHYNLKTHDGVTHDVQVLNMGYFNQFKHKLTSTACGVLALKAVKWLHDNQRHIYNVMLTALNHDIDDVEDRLRDISKDFDENEVLKYVNDVKDFMVQNGVNDNSNNPLSYLSSDDIEYLIAEYPGFNKINNVINNPTQIRASILNGSVSTEYEIIETCNDILKATSATGPILSQMNSNARHGQHFIAMEIFCIQDQNKYIILNLDSALKQSGERAGETNYIGSVLNVFDLIICVPNLNHKIVSALNVVDYIITYTAKLIAGSKDYTEMLIGEFKGIIAKTYPRYSLKELDLDKRQFNVQEFINQVYDDWDLHDLPYTDLQQLSLLSKTYQNYYDALQPDNKYKLQYFMLRSQYCNLRLLATDIDHMIQSHYTIFSKDQFGFWESTIIALHTIYQSLTFYIYTGKNDTSILHRQIRQLLQLQSKLQEQVYIESEKLDEYHSSHVQSPPSKKIRQACCICGQKLKSQYKICYQCGVKFHIKCYRRKAQNCLVGTKLIFCIDCQQEALNEHMVLLPSALLLSGQSKSKAKKSKKSNNKKKGNQSKSNTKKTKTKKSSKS